MKRWSRAHLLQDVWDKSNATSELEMGQCHEDSMTPFRTRASVRSLFCVNESNLFYTGSDQVLPFYEREESEVSG